MKKIILGITIILFSSLVAKTVWADGDVWYRCSRNQFAPNANNDVPHDWKKLENTPTCITKILENTTPGKGYIYLQFGKNNQTLITQVYTLTFTYNSTLPSATAIPTAASVTPAPTVTGTAVSGTPVPTRTDECARCDIDNDGTVTVMDYSELKAHIGTKTK